MRIAKQYPGPRRYLRNGCGNMGMPASIASADCETSVRSHAAFIEARTMLGSPSQQHLKPNGPNHKTRTMRTRAQFTPETGTAIGGLVMTLVSYEPWTLVNRLNRQLDQVFNRTPDTAETASAPSVSWIPRVDIYEEAQRFIVLADVPGVKAKDIDITAEKGVLTIRGERRAEKIESDKNGYERIERTSGSFLRRFTLPDSAGAGGGAAGRAGGVRE